MMYFSRIEIDASIWHELKCVLYCKSDMLFASSSIAPEKFVNITVEEGAPELTLQCNRKEHRVTWFVENTLNIVICLLLFSPKRYTF